MTYPTLGREWERRSPLEKKFEALSQLLDKPEYNAQDMQGGLSIVEEIYEKAAKHPDDRSLLIKLARRLANKFVLIDMPEEGKRTLGLALKSANAISGDISEALVQERQEIIDDFRRLFTKPASGDINSSIPPTT